MATYSYRLWVTVGSYDVSSVVPHNQVRLRRGRESAGQQPQPSSLVFVMLSSPLQVFVGDAVTLELETATQPRQRMFTGRVTDVDALLDVNASNLNVTCVSDGLGAATREVVGDEPWPLEGDATRIGRILDLASIPRGTIDADVTSMLGRDVDRQNAYALLSSVANESLGVLVDEPDGSVSYQNNQHRDGAPVYTLPTSVIPADSAPTIAAKIGGLVNIVRLRYGVTPEGGEQPEVVERDQASIDAYGPAERSLTTQLADEPNARSIAQAILATYKEARYRSDRVMIPMDRIDAADRAALETVSIGLNVSTPGLPSPAPDPWSSWVEGIVDTWDDERWTRELLLDDFYSQPVDIAPPPPTQDCGGFDWTGSCTQADYVPKGSGVPIVPDTSGAVYEWDGDAVKITFPTPAPESEDYMTLVGSTFSAGWLLGNSGYPHPEPYDPATGDTPDMCQGIGVSYDLSAVTDCYVRDETNVWHPWPSFFDDWYCGGDLHWEPEVGWGPTAEQMQDGFAFGYQNAGQADPLPLPGLGCSVWPEDAFISDPALRTSTVSPGRWSVFVGTLTFGLPSGPVFPLFTPFYWTGGDITITVETRTARSDWWHTQPPPASQRRSNLREAQRVGRLLRQHARLVAQQREGQA